MEQKIIKVGSSIAVVIPKPLAKENGFSAGNMVTITTREGSNQIIIEPSKTKEKSGNEELIAWAEDAVKRYRPALEALARNKELDIDPDVLAWTNEFIQKNKDLLKRLKDERHSPEEVASWLEKHSSAEV